MVVARNPQKLQHYSGRKSDAPSRSIWTTLLDHWTGIARRMHAAVQQWYNAVQVRKNYTHTRLRSVERFIGFRRSRFRTFDYISVSQSSDGGKKYFPRDLYVSRDCPVRYIITTRIRIMYTLCLGELNVYSRQSRRVDVFN